MGVSERLLSCVLARSLWTQAQHKPGCSFWEGGEKGGIDGNRWGGDREGIGLNAVTVCYNVAKPVEVRALSGNV